MPVAALATRLVLPPDERIGVALSGGGDSVALLHLLKAAGRDVEAVTVDHRLRPESAAEAAAVARACTGWGVPHEVRVWTHGAVKGNLMQAARRARMALIADWARARGLAVVALGHTADDQAETLLMGLSRAAGLDGLCGMRAAWQEAGLQWVRPILALGRNELRLWLRARGIDWIDDPTNDNDRFLRSRARKALRALAPLGVTVASLAETAGHLQAARAALVHATAEAAVQVCREAAGALKFEPEILAAQPPEVQRRLVQGALLWLSGAEYPPRSDAVARLIAAILAGKDATLQGCRLKAGWLAREPKAVAGERGRPWDQRWTICGPKGEVRALGCGLKQIADWPATGIPRSVLEVTPAIWDGDILISAPIAGFGSRFDARVCSGFVSFLLSH